MVASTSTAISTAPAGGRITRGGEVREGGAGTTTAGIVTFTATSTAGSREAGQDASHDVSADDASNAAVSSGRTTDDGPSSLTAADGSDTTDSVLDAEGATLPPDDPPSVMLPLAGGRLSTGRGLGAGFGAGAADGAVSPPVSAGLVGSASPEPSQSQTHTQFQSQSSPVSSPATVVISVVSPHHVNVQVQSHEGSPEVSSPAGAAGCAVFVWVTGPSSPGLRTRIDTLVFAGPGCGTPDPRTSLVVGEFDPGSGEATGSESQDQFQIQFHTQSRDS
jgi:hypothetical protein